MAQNALELYKYIKTSPELKLDLNSSYVQQPAEQNFGFYFSPEQQMNFNPVEMYGEGGSTSRGHLLNAGIHGEIPLAQGSLSGNIGGTYLKDGPFTQKYINNSGVSYNTPDVSLGGEYSNNLLEFAPLNHDMESPTNFLGQNYLARAKFRY